MSLLENIRLALNGLKTSKMRALLTMLGIIIGVGAVIAIYTVGDSMTGSITNSMSSLGVNNIMVHVRERESFEERGFAIGDGSVDEEYRITDEMLEELRESHPDEIRAVSLSESAGTGKARDGRLYANVTITGANADYQEAHNIEVLDGRFLMDQDIQGKKEVAVVSDKLVKNMFGDADPLEQEIQIYTDNQILTYTIVGIYKYEANAILSGGTASDQDLRTNMYIPVTTAKKLSGSGNGYSSLTVVSSGAVDSEEAVNTIESFFGRYYPEDSKYMVSTNSMESMMDSMTSMLSTVQIAIIAIAAISLLVGGIGVMNIMLVSVTERTREIGTRKALGARSSSIRWQFVTESMIICLIGGLIGVVFGVALGAFASNLLGTPASASLPIIVIAVLFSIAIGVFFGYYPAGKAAKLDPIEALRYE